MGYAAAFRAVAAVTANSRTRAVILVVIPRNAACADVGAAVATRAPASAAAGSSGRIPGCVVGCSVVLDRSSGIVDIIVARRGSPVDPVRGKVRVAEVHVLRKRND